MRRTKYRTILFIVIYASVAEQAATQDLGVDDEIVKTAMTKYDPGKWWYYRMNPNYFPLWPYCYPWFDGICPAAYGEAQLFNEELAHPEMCGDGICDQSIGENSLNCPIDCASCGDGICDGAIGESSTTCPLDCEVLLP